MIPGLIEPTPRPPWGQWALILASTLALMLSVISLAVHLVVIAFVLGYSWGRWREVDRSSESSRRTAIVAIERFIADADRALRDGDVADEHVDELETRVRAAQQFLAMLDSMAPRRLRVWPPGVVRQR
jgi:hypothetical protein